MKVKRYDARIRRNRKFLGRIFTPTLSGSAGYSAPSRYVRTGNTVTVSMTVTVQPLSTE